MKNIILIGDSIRTGYQPSVISALQGEANVWGPEENGGTSRNVLEHLDEWVFSRPSDIVHLNCGLHDLVRLSDENVAEHHRVPLDEYERNVHEILSRIQATGKLVVWATITPVRGITQGFVRHEGDVEIYNGAALRVVQQLTVPINDLGRTVHELGRDIILLPDGVHYSPKGSEQLGQAVAAYLRTVL